jgi:hypothetical protein
MATKLSVNVYNVYNGLETQTKTTFERRRGSS